MAFDRISLGCSPIEYSKVDFLTPIEEMRPYRVFDRRIVQHYTKGPHYGTRYPPDISFCQGSIIPCLTVFSQRCQVSKCTQTEDIDADADTDTTLMEIDPPTQSGGSKGDEKK